MTYFICHRKHSSGFYMTRSCAASCVCSNVYIYFQLIISLLNAVAEIPDFSGSLTMMMKANTWIERLEYSD